MLNIISLALGTIAALFTVLAVAPLLGIETPGYGNWFILPLAAAGLGFGLFAAGKSGRNLNLVVIVILLIARWAGLGIS